MKTLLKHLSCFCLFFIFGANYAIAQNYQHDFDQVVKKVDDLLWYEKVGDIAHIDKVYLCGPARWKETNPTGMSAGNELKFWTYIFIPKSVDPDKKYPLIVLPHSGVHADFNTYYAHIVRELIAQEYIVVSAEYRGSTGYGKATYDNIDYGGLENEDVYVSRNYMVENFDIVDANRIGIMGWSHGGMITLMNLFTYPGKYKCGFAGVPVSTNTSDDDVNVVEVEHMIRALKAEGKKFDYKIFDRAPGAHSFDRTDTKQASEIRLGIYQFLAKHLKPNKPFKSVKDVRKAAYKFN